MTLSLEDLTSHHLRIGLFFIVVTACGTTIAGSDQQGANPDSTAYIQSYQRYVNAVKARDFEAAVQAAHNAFSMAQQVLPADSVDLYQLQFNYGQALLHTHNKTRAVAELREALDRAEVIYGEQTEALIDPLFVLGSSRS